MRTDRMSLDPRAFGLAAGLTAAALFTLCALAVAVAPGATAAYFTYLLHLDLTGLVRPLTWGSYFAGLLCWSVGTGLVFAAAAGIYNRLLGPVPAVVRSEVAAHRV